MKPKPIHRFILQIKITDSCWLWTGTPGRGGYGKFSFNNKTIAAHRWSYEFFVGPIPRGLLVCHGCDNPACVNPKHLWLGTHKQNHEDSMKKGRQKHSNALKTHCKNGHEFNKENTYIHKGKRGTNRRCRICSYMYLQSYKRKDRP